MMQLLHPVVWYIGRGMHSWVAQQLAWPGLLFRDFVVLEICIAPASH